MNMDIDNSKMQKRLTKAVRLSIIAKQLGMNITPGKIRNITPSTRKPVPKRLAEINLDDLNPIPRSKKKNARKQLWSIDTNTRTLRTSMKHNKENVRKYGGQSNILYRKTNPADQTIPLVNLEEFDENSGLYKKIIISEPKANATNMFSNIKFAKPVATKTVTKSTSNFSFPKPVAKLCIKPPNPPKVFPGPSTVSKIPQPGRKREPPEINLKISEIEKNFNEKLKEIDTRLTNLEILVHSQALCNRCSCAKEISNKNDELTGHVLTRLENITSNLLTLTKHKEASPKNAKELTKDKSPHNKLDVIYDADKTMECVKKCLFHIVTPEEKEFDKTLVENNSILNDSFSSTDLLITKGKGIRREINSSEESSLTIDNNERKKDKVTEVQHNYLDKCTLKTNSKTALTVNYVAEFQEDLKHINKIQNIIQSDETNKMIKTSEAGCRQISVDTNIFEILEQRIKNGLLIDSASIPSDPNSPCVEMQMEKLICNDLLDDDVFETTSNTIKNHEQISASTISANDKVCTPTSDTEKTYNQMKENLKFLCTPMVKKTVTLITSTKQPNSHRKILSRRVQEQLFLLNDV